jgi:hypothetical protein
MEDFKKNYILLSKVAKEKKYAQEYLGLLARRGDIGSIRIGKRWYTKRDWVFEFEKDAEVRKMEMKIAGAEIEVKTKVETKIFSAPAPKIFMTEAASAVGVKIKKEEEVKIFPRTLSIKAESIQKTKEKNISLKSSNVEDIRRDFHAKKEKEPQEKMPQAKVVEKASPVEKVSFREFPRINRELPMIDLRKAASRGNSPLPRLRSHAAKASDDETRASQSNYKKKEEVILPKLWLEGKENKERNDSGTHSRVWRSVSIGNASPNFAAEESVRMPLFQKFAFAMSVALLIILLFQVSLVSTKSAGIVAGAVDSRVDASLIKNSSLEYLGNQGDKVKENISLSRVIIRAAAEREGNQGE